jgi:hypothetical protein
MPFRLTNVPATFQALMNEVLRPFLRLFVLVFFDDILIYSLSWMEHLQHIRLILAELQQHKLFLKCQVRFRAPRGSLSRPCHLCCRVGHGQTESVCGA